MLVGARRSSPGIEELRYDCGRGFRDEDDCMFPVKGARSELYCKGSSRSLMSARESHFSQISVYNYKNVPSSGSIKSCSISVL